MNAEHLATIRQALGYYYWRKELELSEERTRVESALAALDTLVQGTWEPVPDGAYNDFVLDGNGKRIVMFINQEYGDDWCYLDKDMAICRRTTPQAAQDTTSTPPAALPDSITRTDAFVARALDNVLAGRSALDGMGDLLGESQVREWQSLSDWAMASLEEMRRQDRIIADALAPLMDGTPPAPLA